MDDHSARYMQAHKIDTKVKANVVYCTATRYCDIPIRMYYIT